MKLWVSYTLGERLIALVALSLFYQYKLVHHFRNQRRTYIKYWQPGYVALHYQNWALSQCKDQHESCNYLLTASLEVNNVVDVDIKHDEDSMEVAGDKRRNIISFLNVVYLERYCIRTQPTLDPWCFIPALAKELVV